MTFQSSHPILGQVEKALISIPKSADQTKLAKEIIITALASVKMTCPALVYVATDCQLIRLDVTPPKSDRELIVAQSIVREASMRIYNELNRRQERSD